MLYSKKKTVCSEVSIILSLSYTYNVLRVLLDGTARSAAGRCSYSLAVVILFVFYLGLSQML